MKDQCLLAIELGNGDFILGGYSGSGMDGDKSQWNMGHTDGWLLRVDQYGNKIWDQSYGGNGWDELEEIGLLPDGNLLIFADSTSPSGSYKNSNTNGVNDYWALKVNAGNGAIIWDKSYDGNDYDYLDHGVLHDDGSFVMVGLSYDGSANTGDRQSSAVGQKDLWVVRADANGSILWEKSFGGESSVGWESRILGLSDGSYVLSTNIHGVLPEMFQSLQKVVLKQIIGFLKLTEMETRYWDRRYGEQAVMVHAVLSPHRMVDFADRELCISCRRDKSHGRFSYISWEVDLWALKLDENGNKANTLYDPDGDDLTWAISGGADAAKFSINAVTGELSFVGGDYEDPQDSDQDNTYEVTLRASDPSGQYADQLVRISVTDANDSPTNTGPVALNNSNFQTAVDLWFANQPEAISTYGHIRDWNTSAVTDMSNAFKDRANFNEDISGWDMSNVTNMMGMFHGASLLTNRSGTGMSLL